MAGVSTKKHALLKHAMRREAAHHPYTNNNNKSCDNYNWEGSHSNAAMISNAVDSDPLAVPITADSPHTAGDAGSSPH